MRWVFENKKEDWKSWGENIVNVHVYKKGDDKPTKAIVKLIRIKPYKERVTKEFEFSETGEEKTMFRFKTDKRANVIDVNDLQKILTNPLEEWDDILTVWTTSFR